MADISKCAGKGCKLKEACYRYTAKADEMWQSYVMADESLTPEQTHCDMFWPDEYAIERENENKKVKNKKVATTRKKHETTRTKCSKRNAK